VLLAQTGRSRQRSVNAGAHSPPTHGRLCVPGACQFTARSRHGMTKTEERTGANRSAPATRQYPLVREDACGDRRDSQTLRVWRESQGWDVPRMAREFRKAGRDSGEDVAAHHGLVKMIPQWERGGPRRSGEVRSHPADAEDEDEQSGSRQLRDQPFELGGGLAGSRDLVHAALLTGAGVVAAKEHGAVQDSYPRSARWPAWKVYGAQPSRPLSWRLCGPSIAVDDSCLPWLLAR
jgi:hypothetical protein